MYILCMIILIFFAVIGLCAFISALVDCLYRSDGEAVLILKELSADNAEARIRSAARICHHHAGMSVVCICGEEDPTYDICALMQKEFPFLRIQSGDTESN